MIYIHVSAPSNDKLPLASSRLWGWPDLPAHMKLPHQYQTFIGQFNLADFARPAPEPENLLPGSGLLSVFADIEHFFCTDIDSDIGMSYSDACTVIYTPENEFASLTRRHLRRYTPMNQRVTLNTIRYSLAEPEHQLLGMPAHREWDDWDFPYQGWQLLFQLDSCDAYPESLNFYDCGVLNIIINPSDLARLDFSRIRAIVLST